MSTRTLFEMNQAARRRILAGVLFGVCALPALAAPVALRVNLLVDPLGVDDATPSLSWQSSATAKNWMQAAYRVEVATTPELLRRGKADVWDSGRVASAE